MIVDVVTAFLSAVVGVFPMDSPNVTPVAPPGAGKITAVLGWIMWIGTGIGLTGLVVCGAIIAINNRRGEGVEMGKMFGTVLAGLIVMSLAGPISNFLM